MFCAVGGGALFNVAKIGLRREHSIVCRIIADGVAVTHAKDLLERLTGPDKIKYIVSFEEIDSNAYQCSIKINNADIDTLGGCLTKDEAVMRGRG